jgi:hypothetical protein
MTCTVHLLWFLLGFAGEYVYWFARVAIAKYHKLGDSFNKNLFSHTSEVRSPKTRCPPSWFLMRLPSWLVGGHLLAVFSCVCPCLIVVCVLVSFSDEDTSYITLESTHMTSVYFKYFFKDPISKYSHILRYWGLECQHIHFGWRWESIIQSITIRVYLLTG